MTSRRVMGIWLAASMALLMMAAPALGQVESSSSKLQVHGYLSQAYATSDHGQFLGIPDDGTSNYRTMALQFSYAMNDNENMTVQLAHEKQGNSPLSVYRDDVELDWAFYERRFANGTSAKVGRIQVPAGIYNEIRDVGILMPFYRPDHNFYGDGAFSTETVDGLSLSRDGSFGSSDWSFEGALFYGSSSVLVPDDGGDTGVFEMTTKDMVGGQLWLNSPIEGVRFGTSGMTTTASGLGAAGEESRINVYRGSFEAALQKFQVRSEGSISKWDAGEYSAWYAQLGIPLGAKFSLNGAYTTANIKIDVQVPMLGTLTLDDTWDEEYAVGLNYHHGYDLVVKLEHHINEGYNIDGIGYSQFPNSPGESEYTLMSLSKAF